MRFLAKTFLLWHIVSGIILLIAGWLYGGWPMAASFVVWGMAVRMLTVLHVTWCVNSVTHIWGYRTFLNTRDDSRNNPVIGILALGEGWHNNHHANPVAANHGYFWYEFDATYWSIRALTAIGLAWNVKFYDRHSKKMVVLYPPDHAKRAVA